MTDEEYRALSEDEKKALAKRECNEILWQLEFLDAGLAVRRAGLIWRLPLCHDYCNENY